MAGGQLQVPSINQLPLVNISILLSDGCKKTICQKRAIPPFGDGREGTTLLCCLVKFRAKIEGWWNIKILKAHWTNLQYTIFQQIRRMIFVTLSLSPLGIPLSHLEAWVYCIEHKDCQTWSDQMCSGLSRIIFSNDNQSHLNKLWY